MDYKRLKWAAKRTAILFAMLFAAMAAVGGLVWLVRDLVESELIRDIIFVGVVVAIGFVGVTAIWYHATVFETGESLWSDTFFPRDNKDE